MNDPVLEPRHPSRRRADPETAVAAGGEGQDPRVLDAGGVAGVEDGEADAVEADEPAEAPDPQIAVAGLGDGLDELLGQAVTGQPHVVSVAVRRPPRVEGPEGRSAEKRQRDASGPDPEGSGMPSHTLTTGGASSAAAK
jgi:hypothetical protein